MPVMALQNIPNVTFRMPIYESYLPVCIYVYLGYQADTESESTASAFSSVGKHAVNRRHTDIANFAFAESRNPETLSSVPVTTKVP